MSLKAMTNPMMETDQILSEAHAIADRFQIVYGTKARGIFRAPGRVNLIGEHTDYNDGFVMPASIANDFPEFHDKYSEAEVDSVNVLQLT